MAHWNDAIEEMFYINTRLYHENVEMPSLMSDQTRHSTVWTAIMTIHYVMSSNLNKHVSSVLMKWAEYIYNLKREKNSIYIKRFDLNDDLLK